MNKNDFKKLKPVALYVRDQTTYLEEKSIDDKFALAELWIIGYLIKEDEEKIVIAKEYHFSEKEGNSVRYTTSIQKTEIIQRIELRRK